MGWDQAALDRLPETVTGQRSTVWWGMIILLVTEASIFLYLLSGYYNLRYHNAPSPWPLGGIPKPDLIVPSINTLILLSSSIPMEWGLASISRGNQRGLKLGLALAFALGALFLIIQAWDVAQMGISVSTNAYTSIFLTTTAFHGLHLFVALIINGVIQVLAWLRYFNGSRYVGVQAATLYWHFVDGVWIAVFFTLHVSPYVL
jgi:cytochrome c oxidase subunit III